MINGCVLLTEFLFTSYLFFLQRHVKEAAVERTREAVISWCQHWWWVRNLIIMKNYFKKWNFTAENSTSQCHVEESRDIFDKAEKFIKKKIKDFFKKIFKKIFKKFIKKALIAFLNLIEKFTIKFIKKIFKKIRNFLW